MSILIHRAFEREKRDVDLDSQFEMSILPRHLEISRNAFWWRGAILFVPVGTKSAPRAQKRFRRENVTASPYGRKRAGKKSSELAKSQRTKHRSAAIEAAIPANTPHTTPLYNTKMVCIASTFTGSVAALKASNPGMSRDARARSPALLRPGKLTSANVISRGRRGASGAGARPRQTLRRIARRRRSPNALFRRSPRPAPRPARRPRCRETGEARALPRILVQLTARSRITQPETDLPAPLRASQQAVCVQGHQGRHLPRVRHLPRRWRVPHHPLRLREERRA